MCCEKCGRWLTRQRRRRRWPELQGAPERLGRFELNQGAFEVIVASWMHGINREHDRDCNADGPNSTNHADTAEFDQDVVYFALLDFKISI